MAVYDYSQPLGDITPRYGPVASAAQLSKWLEPGERSARSPVRNPVRCPARDEKVMRPIRRLRSGGHPRAAALATAVALVVAALLGAAPAGTALARPDPGDPGVILPGWILVQPGSAHGAGVHYGPQATISAAAEVPPASRSSRPSRPSHRGWVKYYIVPHLKGGHKEFLRRIAADTLGKGSLFLKIFKLNKGRLQPGGGRLEHPDSAIPSGWILVLPARAHGAGVHYGPLPAITPAPSPSATPPATSSPSVAAKPPAPPRRSAVAPSFSSYRLVESAVIGAILVGILVAASLLIRRRRHDGASTSQTAVLAASPPAELGGDEPSFEVLLTAARNAAAASGDPAAPGTLAASDQPLAPDWLGMPAPLADTAALATPDTWVTAVIPTKPPAPVKPPVLATPTAIDDELSWPEFLRPTRQTRKPAISGATFVGSSAARPPTAMGSVTISDPAVMATSTASIVAGPVEDRAQAAGTPDQGQGFSPAALRILGAQQSSAWPALAADAPAQRHQVAFGDDRIEVVLAEAPAVSHTDGPRGRHSWLASAPYLAWAPLPYDIPEGGVAFACLGIGGDGCLFIDLAAAPGAVSIGGDSAAASRLAESIAHQLCMAVAAGHACAVTVVGTVIPEPHPSGATSVATLGDLGSAVTDGSDGTAEIVFCELRSDHDAFALASYVGGAQHHVVPVVLANLPDAPWSFTAQPSSRPIEAPCRVIA